MKKQKKKPTTDDGRTIMRPTSKEIIYGPKRAENVQVIKEEPKSAKRNQRTWQLWKFVETLQPDDIQFMITNRKEKLRYETNPDEIRNLRTDISILEDAYRIIKRRNKK